MISVDQPAPMVHPAPELWRHPDPTSTPMWRFMASVNDKYGLHLRDYPDLYAWSVKNVGPFWEEVWRFVGIKASADFQQVIPQDAPLYPRPDFFGTARLNFAENLLYPQGPSSPLPSSTALITVNELPDQAHRTTSWESLRESVRRTASALRAIGLRPGEVVAGYVSNNEQAIVAMLATTSIGAIWTGISPDTGVSAALDRLTQLGPSVLFADNGTVYNGKEWSSTSKTCEILKPLVNCGLHTVVVVQNITGDLGLAQLKSSHVAVFEYEAFLASAADEPLVFAQLPPSHPVYILFSSGTTGMPKPIVHTSIGTLIQHKKEHMLHCSMDATSTMLYYTTTSWMMWHWSVGALAVGATLVLYTGSPFRPHSHLSLPKILSDLKVTHFGTSAAYLTALEASQIYPVREPGIDLSSLQAIYSTASPLPPSTFNFVYEAFPRQINLASITGGTDIISLFGAPCPLLPVRTGEIQCAGLGMAIRAVDAITGEEVPAGAPGDLVCIQPFPCQPLTFLGEKGDERYKAAYFERFSDICGAKGAVWHHGDFVKIPEPSTGSLVMLGRSDGVLKPSGVRFGSAEIYNILTKFFAAEIEDAVCVGRRRETDVDETVCLFVVMVSGQSFTDELRTKIKTKIRTELSPRHVPGVIDECGGGVPKTSNGKKIEVAVKQILSGMDIKTNASVANPEALEWFKRWANEH